MMIIVIVTLCLMVGVSSFGSILSKQARGVRSLIQMTSEEPSSFRDLQVQQAKSVGSTALKVLLGASFLPQPASAAKLSACNEVLTGYGLPPILFVPPGFSPIVSEFGRGNVKEGLADNPILVQFAHPSNWVEARTSVNNNGEAGTISANDYIKGDSAFLYTYLLDGSEGKVTKDNKQLLEKIVLKGITQKGDVTEEFKVRNIREGAKGVNGQEYVLADIFYKLNTEAGFLISRQGFIAITSVGKYAQSLTAVSTDKRYNKGLKEKLSDVVDSFRVYKLQSGVFTKPEES